MKGSRRTSVILACFSVLAALHCVHGQATGGNGPQSLNGSPGSADHPKNQPDSASVQPAASAGGVATTPVMKVPVGDSPLHPGPGSGMTEVGPSTRTGQNPPPVAGLHSQAGPGSALSGAGSAPQNGQNPPPMAGAPPPVMYSPTASTGSDPSQSQPGPGSEVNPGTLPGQEPPPAVSTNDTDGTSISPSTHEMKVPTGGHLPAGTGPQGDTAQPTETVELTTQAIGEAPTATKVPESHSLTTASGTEQEALTRKAIAPKTKTQQPPRLPTTAPRPPTTTRSTTRAAPAESSAKPVVPSKAPSSTPQATTSAQQKTPSKAVSSEPESTTATGGGADNFIHGLDKNSFTAKVLLPIAAGIILAVFIVLVVWSVRSCLNREANGSKRRLMDHDMAPTDRVMLLAESSEDEF